MSRWTIYNKDGKERAVQWSADVSENVGEYAEPQLEYHGTWMGECFVTLTVKCAVPVDFQIGDYIVYRGEKFVINYDPTVVKRARRGTYGEGFTYDNIKFNALHNELTEVMFLDYVLGDNGLHYTSLPVFPFFAATIDDFCDRLQANTNRYCKNNGIAADDKWLFLTPALDRTRQRALSCGMSEAEAMRRWEEAYGSGTSTEEIKTDVSVSISNQTIWNAMAMIKNSFGLNFINRGRSVIIGSAGLPTNHIFEYGKGNGLYEIERVADSEQQIVTKMYAYGNETNLPVRYYANIGVRCFARPTRMTFGSLTYYFLDMKWDKNLYSIEETFAGVDGYRVVVSNGSGQTATAYVSDPSGLTNISEGVSLDDLTVIVFNNSAFTIPLNGQELNFESGINKDKWPSAHREYPQNLPNNMAVNKLMLPGFPLKSLYQWVKENGGTNCDDTTGKATWHGYTAYFSKDKYQPYVQSLNSDELGIREYAKTFDGSDGDEDIFPTIEDTGFDVITGAQQIDDNGIFAEGDDEPTVTLTLPSFGTGFDLKEQAGLGDSPAIVMKDGYCGGRSFSFEAANVVKNSNGTFTIKCKREHDNLLDLWFPYSYNKSKGQSSTADEPYQVCAGDKYVLTGIPMTDAYIEANAVKLLEASLLWLSKNDYTRHTYLPKVDEIYMARQHDEYKRGENARSLYLTIKEGDLLRFMDEDLHIGDSMIFIDSLTIKEYGNAQIPTYELSLRNDKSVGTIERMQEQINSLTTGTSVKSSGGGSGSGMTANQVNSLIEGTGEKLFLSKLKDDVANGLITFVKGLVSKARALFEGDVEIQGLLQGTRARLNSIKSEDYSGDGMGDTGWQITNAYNGHSKLTIDELYVRMKAVFESLEVKERKVSGGDLTFTGAANVIVRTDYLDEGKNVLGYDTVKVPWWLTNGTEMFMTDRRLLDIFSREARIKRSFNTLDQSVIRQIRYVRCYFLAKDGSGNAVYNMWQMDDLVRCQTFNMQQQEREGGVNSRDIPSEKEGESYSRQQNTFWWRKVMAVSSEPVTIDGRDYHWFDVAYDYDEESRATANTSWCALGSDIPCAGDNACQFGNTDNPERMNAISIEINGAGNSDAPAIKVYRGIYTFSLKKCWWGGESTRKGMWSPSAGFEVYAPLFKFITEYGTYREAINRGSWLSIGRKQDDYGNSVQYEGDDEPTQLVRKCYYYNQVSHKGSIWLCTMANDDFHWVNASGRYISDSTYNALSDEEKARCTRVQNYTTDEPSETSPAWTKQVEKGDKGESSLPSFVFRRSATKPDTPTGGSYTSPKPNGWSDGIPAGTAPIWMTSRIFTTDGKAPQQAAWATPRLLADTDSFDVEFAKQQPDKKKPAAPNGTNQKGGSGTQVWFDPSEIDEITVKSDDMVWMATRSKIVDGSGNPTWGPWTVVKIKGEDGGQPIFLFKWFDGTTESVDKPNVSVSEYDAGNLKGWSKTAPNRTSDLEGWHLWMTQNTRFAPTVGQPTIGTWSDPVRITGDTGTPGEDGSDTEWIYTSNNTGEKPDTPANPSDRTKDDYVPDGWSDNAHGVDYSQQYEYASFRHKPKGKNQTWGDFFPPIIWSHWGTNGMDGDGVEYVFVRTQDNVAPTITNSSDEHQGKTWRDDEYLPLSSAGRCTDDPANPDATYRYQWCAKRTKKDPDPVTGKREWNKFSGEMKFWNKLPNDGAPGGNTATIYLYKRSATPVTSIGFTDTLTYTFATKLLDATPNGWSQQIPGDSTDPIYVTAATAFSTGATDTIRYNEWATPVAMAKNGQNGQNGLNTATVFLFQRKASTPAKPSANLTYTFATGILSGNLAGWSQQMPASNGNPCWVIQATAISTETTDTIGYTEWSEQHKLVEDGITPDVHIDPNTRTWVINGEDTGIVAEGKDGTGVEIKGTVAVLANLTIEDGKGYAVPMNSDGTTGNKTEATHGDCYICDANRHLYMFTTTPGLAWNDLGEFKGEPGQSSYVHIAYATSITLSNGVVVGVTGFTVDNDGTEYDWWGFCTDNNKTDPGRGASSTDVEAARHYKWNYMKGRDGSGSEHVYLLTKDGFKPTLNQSSGKGSPSGDEFLPSVSNYQAGMIYGNSQYFEDDPPASISEQWPVLWWATRKYKDGAWQAFGDVLELNRFKKGDPGDDGVGLTINPSYLIFEEKKDGNTKYIDYSNNAVTIQYREGSVLKEITVEKYRWFGIDESGWSISGSGTTAVTVTIDGGIRDGVTSGNVDVKVSSGAFSLYVRIPFYVPRAATWQQKIEDGVETSIAQKISYNMGETQVEKIEEVGKYIRGYRENISQLSRAVKGKNLIRELIRGWCSYEGKTDTVSYGEDWSISDSYNDLYSPVILLSAGTQYCFSAYFDQSPDNNSVYAIEALSQRTYADGSALYNSPYTATPAFRWYQVPGTSRYYFTFRTGSNDMLFVFNYFAYQSELRKPQLEVGSTPTEFAVTNYEVLSQIKQTADEIMAEVSGKASQSELKQTADSISGTVTDLKTGLIAAGMVLDGNNSSIKLIADKVGFYDSNGKASPYITITSDGKMKATDGEFSGKITATSGTFSGSLNGASGTFTGSVLSNNNNVILTKQKGAFGFADYTWAGFAATNSGVEAGDLATIGARLNDGGYDYGRIALVKRNAGTSGTIDSNTSIFMSAKDGSIEAAAYKIKRWGSWAKGNLTLEDTEENRRYQLLIYTDANDGSLTLKTNPEHGTVLIVKRQKGSGWLIIYNANGEEIGNMSIGGVMMCVYNGIDHKWQ